MGAGGETREDCKYVKSDGGAKRIIVQDCSASLKISS
jgi:hypothetical protein